MASRRGTRKPTAGPASVNKSHKSFKPMLPCGNKFLQQKWDQTYYEEHRKLVRSAKPIVDTKAPHKRSHVVSKLKRKQVESERLDEIDRDNLTLLKRMQRIMRTEGCVDHRNHYHHHSLNYSQRRKEMARVEHENRRMLKRIETVETVYKMSDLVDDWQKKEALLDMITSYPEDNFVSVKPKESIKMNFNENKSAHSTFDTGPAIMSDGPINAKESVTGADITFSSGGTKEYSSEVGTTSSAGPTKESSHTSTTESGPKKKLSYTSAGTSSSGPKEELSYTSAGANTTSSSGPKEELSYTSAGANTTSSSGPKEEMSYTSAEANTTSSSGPKEELSYTSAEVSTTVPTKESATSSEATSPTSSNNSSPCHSTE